MRSYSFLYLHLTFVSSAMASLNSSSAHNVTTLHQFPVGFWVENLVVRSTNSKLLITTLASPNIYELSPDPSPSNEPIPIATLPEGRNATTGIVETEPDVFAVVAGVAPTFPQGSWQIWKLDLRPDVVDSNGTGQLTNIANVTNAGLLNGLTLLQSPNIILAADTFQPYIWRIDVSTGEATVAINDSILAAPAGKLGANGVKVFPKLTLRSSSSDDECSSGSTNMMLYFTNTNSLLFGSFPIDPVSGAALAPATQIAFASPANDGKTNYDDFDLDSRGNAYIANGAGDVVNFVQAGTGEQSVIAGALNSSLVAEPTSVALDKTERVAFVTTTGGLKYPLANGEKVGGQVLRIELGPAESR